MNTDTSTQTFVKHSRSARWKWILKVRSRFNLETFIRSELMLLDREGQQALLRAAEKGDYKTILDLLDEGVNMNGGDSLKRTALHHAVQNGHHGAANFLLECGADPDMKDQNGCTPLHYAATGGHHRIVRLLLRFCSEVVSVGTDENTHRDDVISLDSPNYVQSEYEVSCNKIHSSAQAKLNPN